MTHDYTYLSQLTITDLLWRAREASPDNHLVRALADRLEKTLEDIADYYAVNDALMVANRRADAWREEAIAIQRQLDMVRG